MSLFSCFGKKKENLQSWLDKNFPGQYEIVESRQRFMEHFQFSKKMTTVVSAKADPDVQFVVYWLKDKEGLNVTREEIEHSFEKSKKEASQARMLFQALAEEGTSKVSVGVVDDAAYFLVYDEPTPDARKKYLTQIQSMLDRRSAADQTNIFIEFMEDSVYQQEFKDIVPAGYWARIDHYHEDNNTVSIDYSWIPGMKVEKLMTMWAVNTISKRSSLYKAAAYEQALQWAQKNIQGPFYLEPGHYVWSGKNEKEPMGMDFDFPYYASKPATDDAEIESLRLGYVSGIYQVDQNLFTKIEKRKNVTEQE